MEQNEYLYKCLKCGIITLINEKDLEITCTGKITNSDGTSTPFYEADYYCPYCHHPMIVCEWSEYNEMKTIWPKDNNWGFEKLDGEAKCGYKIVKGD